MILNPFRAYSRSKYTNKEFAFASATDGYLTQSRSYQGIRFVGQAEFVGQNTRRNVMMSIWIKPESKPDKKKKPVVVKKRKKKLAGSKKVPKITKEKKGEKGEKKDKIKFIVVNSDGDTVRTFSRKVEEKALVRMNWNMSADGVRFPSRREPKKDADKPSGLRVLPGKYTIIANYGDHSATTEVEVKLDPRVEGITETDIKDLKNAYGEMSKLIERATKGFDKLKKAKKRVELVEKLAETIQDTTKKETIELCKENKKSIDNLMALYMDKPDLKGIQRNPKTLNRALGSARRYLTSSHGKPTANAQIAIDKAVGKVNIVLSKLQEYFDGDWKSFQEKIDAMDFDLFNLQ